MTDEAAAKEAAPELTKAAAAPAPLVRLSTAQYVTMEYPDTEYPTVTEHGVEVTRTQADAMRTIALKMNVLIREGV